MKKITLAVLVLFALAGKMIAQPTLTINAPPNDGGNSQLAAPSGSADAAYHRGAFLIKASELGGLITSNSVITTVQFGLLQGCSAPVTGQYTLYLQNTTDATFNKGTTWSTILTGMTPNYNGNITIPQTAASTSTIISLNTTPNFTWTGGGIYVAFAFYAPTANSTQLATWVCNYSGLTGGAVRGYTTSAGPAPTTLTSSNFRLSMNLLAQNTATNEVAVLAMDAPGMVAKTFNTGHQIYAWVKNASINALTNVSVAVGSSGANTFANVQTIANFAAGSTSMVTFSAFNPTVSGINNITVSVLPDQNNSNNSLTWSQSVTCNGVAIHPANVTYTTAYGYGGTTGSGCFTSKHNFPANASLTGVLIAIGSYSGNTGQSMYGVVADGSGNIVGTSNTVVVNSASTQNFVFNPPIALTSGTDYYIGVAQPTNGYYPMAYTDATSIVMPDYYNFPLAGGSAPAAMGLNGWFGITPQVMLPSMMISAAATRTRVCAKESTTLNLSGQSGMTYSWSASSINTISPSSNTVTSVVVTPTLSTTSGVVSYSVVGTDGATGCKSNVAAITVSFNICNGLVNNSTYGSIIAAYPNPAVNGKVNVTGLEGSNTITVYNVIGQAVLSFNTSEENAVVDLKDQPSGNYLIKISNANNESKTIKIVNQN